MLTSSTAPDPARVRDAGIDVELVDSFEARRQNEAWRVWAGARRPFVILKLALTLDGRVAVPGTRWVTGEESRRRGARRGARAAARRTRRLRP